MNCGIYGKSIKFGTQVDTLGKCFYAQCVGNYACDWRLRNEYCIQACSSRLLLGCV